MFESVVMIGARAIIEGAKINKVKKIILTSTTLVINATEKPKGNSYNENDI